MVGKTIIIKCPVCKSNDEYYIQNSAKLSNKIIYRINDNCTNCRKQLHIKLDIEASENKEKTNLSLKLDSLVGKRLICKMTSGVYFILSELKDNYVVSKYLNNDPFMYFQNITKSQLHMLYYIED